MAQCIGSSRDIKLEAGWKLSSQLQTVQFYRALHLCTCGGGTLQKCHLPSSLGYFSSKPHTVWTYTLHLLSLVFFSLFLWRFLSFQLTVTASVPSSPYLSALCICSATNVVSFPLYREEMTRWWVSLVLWSLSSSFYCYTSVKQSAVICGSACVFNCFFLFQRSLPAGPGERNSYIRRLGWDS